MDKVYLLSTLVVVQFFNPTKYLFCPKEDDEEIFGPKVPYFNAFGALMYMAQCTRLDIVFFVNLLIKFRFVLTRQHWNGIKHAFRYCCGITDLELLYSNEPMKNFGLVGYYLSNPNKALSHTG